MRCIWYNKKNIFVIGPYCKNTFLWSLETTLDSMKWKKVMNGAQKIFYKKESLTKFYSLLLLLQKNVKITDAILAEQKQGKEISQELNGQIELLLQQL